MIFKCINCNFKTTIKTNRVKCVCGKEYIFDNVDDEKTKPQSYNFSCLNRGDSIGIVDCSCQGNNEVYKCSIYQYCSIRKLRPGLPVVELQDGTKTTDLDLKYCNLCESREEV